MALSKIRVFRPASDSRNTISIVMSSVLAGCERPVDVVPDVNQLFEFLEQRIGPDANLSALVTPAHRAAVNDAFERISNAAELGAFALDRSSRGLGLVSAMLLEEIQIIEMDREQKGGR
jgi:hypothetical protein